MRALRCAPAAARRGRLPALPAARNREARACGACAGRASPLAACFAAAAYAGRRRGWIQRFKYPRRGWRGLDPAPLGVVRQLVSEVARAAPGPVPRERRAGAAAPAPTARARLQSRRAARALRRTRTWRSLRRRAARARARHAEPDRPRPPRAPSERARRVPRARGRSRPASVVWLVDDVVTTGSTLVECARALRRAGARASWRSASRARRRRARREPAAPAFLRGRLTPVL